MCNINNPFQPRFPHDCRACIFMGQSGKYDTYFCPAEAPGEPGGSVIARSGPDDQYSSVPVSQALLLDMHRGARGSDSAATAYIEIARLLLRDGYVGIQINQAEIKRLRDNND